MCGGISLFKHTAFVTESGACLGLPKPSHLDIKFAFPTKSSCSAGINRGLKRERRPGSKEMLLLALCSYRTDGIPYAQRDLMSSSCHFVHCGCLHMRTLLGGRRIVSVVGLVVAAW